MKKVKTYKGYIIAQSKDRFYIFTADEWSHSAGFREPEWEVDSLAEAVEWIG